MYVCTWKCWGEAKNFKSTPTIRFFGVLVFWLWLINYLLYEITFSILSHSAGLWRYFNLNSIVVLYDAMMLDGRAGGNSKIFQPLLFFVDASQNDNKLSILQFEWNSFWVWPLVSHTMYIIWKNLILLNWNLINIILLWPFSIVRHCRCQTLITL